MQGSQFAAIVGLLVSISGITADEYCEDFEEGDLGNFWQQSALDTGGQWEARSYTELKKTIPDFPQPVDGDTVLYLTSNGSYVSARLQMQNASDFPDNSTISFRYWLRSQWSGSGNLEVRRIVGTQEEQKGFLVLTPQSGPTNKDWMETSATIPNDKKNFKLLIFGACGNNKLDNIAIDDVRVCGPSGIEHQCISLITSTLRPSPPVPSTTPPPPSGCSYCEDFESGVLGDLWSESTYDEGGEFEVRSYTALKRLVPEFPPPARGDMVVFLTPLSGGPVSARLETGKELRFGSGGSIRFRYWLRSQYVGRGRLELRSRVGEVEDRRPFFSLTASSGPDNLSWRQANVSVPLLTNATAQGIVFYAESDGGPLDHIALDDVVLCGVEDLYHKCTDISANN